MQPRSTSPLLRFWLLVLVSLMSFHLDFANANSELRRFHVKRGEALKTLRKAVQQADVDFLFAVELLEGARTRPISGEFTPLEAFQEMLKGTGFVPFRHRNSGVFSVRKELKLGSAEN